MKLVVISHTRHFEGAEGIVGWGPTVREISVLADLFDEVVHIAPLSSEPPPPTALPYSSDRVRLAAVAVAGGPQLHHKLDALMRVPGYLGTINREVRDADVVHVRCPAGISMLAALGMPWFGRHAKRWIKYAGTFRPYRGEPMSYRLQRWWLINGPHGAEITVNEQTSGSEHVHPFLNPCLTDDELERGRKVAALKQLKGRAKLLFVGRLESAKGPQRALEVLRNLRTTLGRDAELTIVGEGGLRSELAEQARALGVEQWVRITGGLRREEIEAHYEQAHFIILLSTASEGWPKVLSEGMAFGAVPITSQVGSVPDFLARFGTGIAVGALAVDEAARHIDEYLDAPERWAADSGKAVTAAQAFSYSAHRANVASLLGLKP